MRSPDFTDNDEVNGLVSTLSLCIGILFCMIGPILPLAYLVILSILGGILFIVGLIWTCVAISEGDWNISFLFEDKED